MTIQPIKYKNRAAFIRFNSISELKKKLAAYKLIYGDFEMQLCPSKKLCRWGDLEMRARSWEIDEESPVEIGHKYIIQKNMGYKWEVVGECYCFLQATSFDSPELID